MRIFAIASLLALSVVSVAAAEIDFAVVPVDLDGVPYRTCLKPPAAGQTECGEWLNHSIGLIAYGALNRPPDPVGPNAPPPTLAAQVEEARRAVLARKIYPGKNEKHMVDLSSAEITMVFDAIVAARQQLPVVEKITMLELIDPVRVKGMLEK